MAAKILARKLLASVTLWATLFMGTTDAQELKSVAEEDVWKLRPANMFRMASNNEPSLCNPLLASINEEKVITERRPHPIIQNKYLVYPWRKQTYSWSNPSNGYSGTHHWEVAYVDLDGDGVKDGLFRQEGSIKMQPFHTTMYQHSVDSQLVSNDSLPEVDARKILNSDNRIHLKRDNRRYYFHRSFHEIVINNKNFLLLFSAFYWALETLDRYPFVYVLKRDATQFHQVCHFEGIVKVMRGAPNWNQ